MIEDLERRLRPARGRLRLRRTLDYALRALLGALVLDVLLLLGPWQMLATWPALVAIALLSVLAAFALAAWRGPTTWEAARAVDGLGLAEQVASALHAARVEHATSSLIAQRALAGLDAVDVRVLPIMPSKDRLRLVAGAAVLVLAAAALPLPNLRESPENAAERAAINETREAVEELAAEVEAIAPASVRDELEKELSQLDEALAKTQSRQQAAEALERAQDRIASMVSSQQYTANRTLSALANAWSADPQLGELSRALRERDPEAIAAALETLAKRLPAADTAERQRLELALQAAANLAQDLPALASELRETATALRNDEGPAATAGLSSALGAAASDAQALASTQATLGALGNARASMGAANPGNGVQAGASSGQASSAGSSGGQGSGGSVAQGATGSNGASGSSGQSSGAGQGSGSGQGSGNGQGSGQGGGAGSGQGSGTGQAGSGAGSGAGAGGGPAPGAPGGPNATAGGAGGSGEPGKAGPVPYASVYAPSLLGGEDGTRAEVSGDANGASGETVELPRSPVTAGTLRPYNEVFGEYEAAARQALGRGTLPASLEKLVQDYFSALEPAGTDGQ